MSVSVIGEIGGTPVHAVTLRGGGGVAATIMEWGCVMQDLRLDSVDRSLILSWPNLADYVRHGREHMGAIAGRVANRISGGRFVLDGITYQLNRNVDGRDHLHGGDGGFGRSLWRLINHGPDHASFAIEQPAGAQGYPGAVSVTCGYRLADGALTVDLSATCDAPTPINLAQHNYYNLSGANCVDAHRLQVAASRFTPLGEDLLPTGAVSDLSETMDFSKDAVVGSAVLDHNFILADQQREVPAFAARLGVDDLEMIIETTEPGLQVYTSEHLPGRPRAGICLESQCWPDAINHACFPNTIVRPGSIYNQKTIIRLSKKNSHV